MMHRKKYDYLHDFQSSGLKKDKNYRPSSQAFSNDRASNVHRSVFPCNKTCSKQIIVALEPTLDFRPSVTLCKPGTRGVTLSEDAFLSLMQLQSKLTAFFVGSYVKLRYKFKLNNNAFVELHESGSELVSIVTETYGEPRCQVFFEQTTWQYILDLEKLITRLLEQYKQYAPAALKIFDSISHYVFKKCDSSSGRDVKETEEIVKVCLRNLPNTEYLQDAVHPTFFDSIRTVEEIKLYCIRDIIKKCNAAYEY
jgi:hypothetical protein